MHNKFIIEDDRLILAKCDYHKQLVKDKSKVDGGGWWLIKDNVLYLYSNSQDFGYFNIDKAADLINKKQIFAGKHKTVCMFESMPHIRTVILSHMSFICDIDPTNCILLKIT